MKISCEVIKDLLPLYLDGVCSNESKLLIENHVAECVDCKDELQAMKRELFLNNKEQNLKEADAVKKLSRRWKKGMIKSLLKGAFLTLLVVVAIALILYLFMDIRTF